MAAPKQTKKQRIEEAREAARIAREKREKRQKTLRILIPSLVTLGVILIVVAIVVVIAIQPKPAAAFPGGPKNMASDGIVYVQDGSSAKYVATPALKKGQKPETAETGSADVPHVQTYVDLSCPGCKKFEATYADQLKKMVAAGAITLEVKPIAILQRNYSTDYSDRSANVAACVANYEPSKFSDALTTLYDNQATEGSAGLSNDKMMALIHSAGVTDDKVDGCIRGDSFKAWVTAATTRATSNPDLQASGGGFQTPTVTVNGTRWDGTTDLMAFIQQAGQS